MSESEELKRLEADMASDKELEKKFYETVDRIATESKPQSDGELFAAAAAELGYNITAADFERLYAEQEEISPEELEQASGGGSENKDCWKDYLCMLVWNQEHMDEYGHNGVCITAWHCYAVTLHTEAENHDVRCWKDYVQPETESVQERHRRNKRK